MVFHASQRHEGYIRYSMLHSTMLGFDVNADSLCRRNFVSSWDRLRFVSKEDQATEKKNGHVSAQCICEVSYCGTCYYLLKNMLRWTLSCKHERPKTNKHLFSRFIWQIFPPTEVVQDGCDRVRKWCARRLHDRTMARKHTIVMAVQTILKQVSEYRRGGGNGPRRV